MERGGIGKQVAMMLVTSRLGLLLASLLGLAGVYKVVWGSRFFYETEIWNLWLVSGRGWAELMATVASSDIHPPLPYLANKLWLSMVGPEEWRMSLFSLFLTGIAVGVVAMMVQEETRSWKGAYAFVILAIFHPLVLMWAGTIRWYPLWTALASGAIAVLHWWIAHV